MKHTLNLKEMRRMVVFQIGDPYSLIFKKEDSDPKKEDTIESLSEEIRELCKRSSQYLDSHK